MSNNEILDSMGSVVTNHSRRAATQEPNEDTLRLVWRKCKRQIEVLCLSHAVANLIKVFCV